MHCVAQGAVLSALEDCHSTVSAMQRPAMPVHLYVHVMCIIQGSSSVAAVAVSWQPPSDEDQSRGAAGWCCQCAAAVAVSICGVLVVHFSIASAPHGANAVA